MPLLDAVIVMKTRQINYQAAPNGLLPNTGNALEANQQRLQRVRKLCGGAADQLRMCAHVRTGVDDVYMRQCHDCGLAVLMY